MLMSALSWRRFIAVCRQCASLFTAAIEFALRLSSRRSDRYTSRLPGMTRETVSTVLVVVAMTVSGIVALASLTVWL
jgi:hypothetical protein